MHNKTPFFQKKSFPNDTKLLGRRFQKALRVFWGQLAREGFGVANHIEASSVNVPTSTFLIDNSITGITYIFSCIFLQGP